MMDTTNIELEKNGIKVICPISTYNINEIATFVAQLICSKFPTLKLNYNTIFINNRFRSKNRLDATTNH